MKKPLSQSNIHLVATKKLADFSTLPLSTEDALDLPLAGKILIDIERHYGTCFIPLKEDDIYNYNYSCKEDNGKGSALISGIG